MQPDRFALISVAAVVILAFVGVGYGIEYSGSTLNSNNYITTTYMEFELDGTNTSTFVIPDITYYRDRTPDGTVTYRVVGGESEPMQVRIAGTGAAAGNAQAFVKLAEGLSEAGLSMQFYYDDNGECGDACGDLLTLTTNYIQIEDPLIEDGLLKIGKTYWCTVTVTITNATMTSNLSDTLSFDVVYYATAEAVSE